MKRGKNLQDIPNASKVLKEKTKSEPTAIKNCKLKSSKSLLVNLKVLQEKLKEYSNKDVETMYKETLKNLRKIFEIPEDLSNKEVNITCKIGQSYKTIFLRENSIKIKIINGPDDDVFYSIDKETNRCYMSSDSLRRDSIFDKKTTVFFGVADVVKNFISNKDKCKITVENYEEANTGTKETSNA